jgi:hypothetical protein
MVLNRDIGFVNEGQTATVKIVTISKDAATDEHLGLVYPSRLQLQRTSMFVDAKTMALSPGMAVTVEIKTGRRRLIEYFLSPNVRIETDNAYLRYASTAASVTRGSTLVPRTSTSPYSRSDVHASGVRKQQALCRVSPEFAVRSSVASAAPIPSWHREPLAALRKTSACLPSADDTIMHSTGARSRRPRYVQSCLLTQ